MLFKNGTCHSKRSVLSEIKVAGTGCYVIHSLQSADQVLCRRRSMAGWRWVFLSWDFLHHVNASCRSSLA